MVEEEYTSLLPLVLCYINHMKNRDTGFTPNQVFHVIDSEGKDVLGQIEEDQYPVLSTQGVRHPRSVEQVRKTLETMGQTFQHIVTKVYKIKDRLREQRNKAFKNRFKLEDVQYGEGDFVLMSTADIMKGRNKLKLTWIGPFMVKEIQGHNFYILKDPIGKEVECHSSRMRFYNGERLEFTEMIKNQFLLNRGRFYLKQVNEIKFRNGQYECKCQWYGLESHDDSWEEVDEVFKTAPDPVLEYLNKCSNKEMKQLKERLLRRL